jgi:hypothetical protein
MTQPELAWHTAAERYSRVCRGGTPEERTWAWARAAAALDTWLDHETTERRAKHQTEELEAA